MSNQAKTNEISEQIFKILTHRELRYGSIPDDNKKALIIENLNKSIEKNEPIKVLIGWAACKNKNLLHKNADMAEAKTIKNMKSHLDKINSIYNKGYEITIHHLDKRMADMNGFSMEETENYKKSLSEVLKKEGLEENVKIVSDKELIENNKEEFNKAYEKANKEITIERLRQAPAYDIHMKNAVHNNFKGESNEVIEESLRKMVVYKVAEIESGILKDVPYDVRIFFKSGVVKEGEVPESAIYQHFAKNPYKQSFNTKATLNCYTGSKGNAKQPWMSHGILVEQNGDISISKSLSEEKEGAKIRFFSQSELAERGIKTKCQLCKNCTCGKKFASSIAYESGNDNEKSRELIRQNDINLLRLEEKNKDFMAVQMLKKQGNSK
ncbi:MAG: Pyoverdine/dityrosine biosynthesis protein [Alphaproteobacteria bacterium ADurb.Bin438]|nr:MAG: Pyoverdine/dityrosine biosynthesis protein [Alphaproteobacteria bacterium ADurb.Bin438]